MRLKPEFWAERDHPWQNYFVTIAKRLKNGQICHQHVPIVPREYMENPTEWPRGTTGTFSIFQPSKLKLIFFIFQPSKMKLQFI